MEIKTMAFDLDGTLVDKTGNIQPKTKKAIIDLQNNGIQIILASGRPIRSMLKLAKELELDKHHGIIVTNNGAVGFDVKENKIIYENPIDKALVKEILTDVIADNIEPMIENGEYMIINDVFNAEIEIDWGYGDGLVKHNPMNHEARQGNYMLKEVRDYPNFIDFNVNKILTIVEPSKIKELTQKYKEKYGSKIHVVQTSAFFMEFTNPGINKATGLKSLGINPETLLSFGDNMNDKEMMEYGKYSVAMGNAVDPVKEIATFVTSSNNDEGIYEAFKHFGLV